jgi:hypothetical protein
VPPDLDEHERGVVEADAVEGGEPGVAEAVQHGHLPLDLVEVAMFEL